MLKKLGVKLLKILIAIALLAIAFWPNGAGYYVMKNFEQFPIMYTIICAVWGCALSLNLPLSLTNFRKMSTVFLAVIFAAICVKLYQKGHFDIVQWETWLISMIIFCGFTLGWWTISADIYRGYRRVLPVDDPDTMADDGE